jgi:cob(I)alamin adenosyltransferase
VKTNVGSGDRGITSLLSGERVPKSHARVEACGEVDELASVLGACAAALSAAHAELLREIQSVQSDLLNIGAWLATSPGSPTRQMLRTIGPDRIQEIEEAIDRLEAELPPLQSFILPGGHATAAWAHVARTVCRRAERRVQSLVTDAGEAAGESPGGILPYLNRLSTYLFALARYCNKLHGVPDATWKG